MTRKTVATFQGKMQVGNEVDERGNPLSDGYAIIDKDDMPVLREADVCGNIGSVRELIVDYIENVLGGELRAECDDNWQLTGIAWDQGLHEQAVQLVADGTLSMDYDDKRLPAVPITEADVRAATTAAAS